MITMDVSHLTVLTRSVQRIPTSTCLFTRLFIGMFAKVTYVCESGALVTNLLGTEYEKMSLRPLVRRNSHSVEWRIEETLMD